MKTKFSSVDYVRLKATLEMHDIVIFIRHSFKNGNKYNPYLYLYEGL